MKKINVFDISRLRTEESFGFVKKVIELTAKLPGMDGPITTEGEGGASSTLVDARTLLMDKQDKLDLALKNPTSVPTTKEATQRDAFRDKAWQKSRMFLKIMMENPLAEKSKLAAVLFALYEKYGDPTSLSRTEESGILHNLIQDLSEHNSNFEKIHFTEWFNQLEDAEEAYLDAWKQNDTERKGLAVGVIQQAKKDMENAYRNLVEQVNSLARVYGEEYYEDFIDSMNLLINDHKKVLKLRATLIKKKKADKEK